MGREVLRAQTVDGLDRSVLVSVAPATLSSNSPLTLRTPAQGKESRMRPRLWGLLLAVLLPVAAGAQETRGNINGIVQDSGGVIPGAVIKITNTGTSQTQQLVTNNSG